jgi:hypothetical protein
VNKSKLYGVFGSATFCLIVLLLLLFIFLPGMKTPEDEGIMVSFGETFEGSGKTKLRL